MAMMRFGRRMALGSRYLVTGVPDRNSGVGQVRVYDARDPVALPLVNFYNGAVSPDMCGMAVATEGNRVFFSYQGRLVLGFTPNSPFTRQQVFLTWDALSNGHGQSLAAADERLAAGQPFFHGPVPSSGAVLLHPTTTLPMADFYPGPLTGDAAPGVPGDVRLTSLKEVVTSLREPINTPSGHPLFVGNLSGGVPGVKGPLGVLERSTFFSMTQAVAQSTVALPLLSRPIANHASAVWFRAAPKGNGLPNVLAGFPAVLKLHDGNGMLLGLNLPLKSVGELRVDNGLANRGMVPVLLKPNGGTVEPHNDSGLVQIAADNPLTNSFARREGEALGGGLLLGKVAQRGCFNAALKSFMTGLTGTGVTPDNNQRVVSGFLSVRKGDLAGLPPLAVFQTFTGETHCPPGVGLIRAVISGVGVTAATNEGLWSNRFGMVAPILHKGAQAPILPTGVKVKRLLNYALVGPSDILILAQVAGPGVNAKNDVVLYLSKSGVPEPGQFEVLAREGDRLQALGGAKIGTILRLEATTGPLITDCCRYGVLCSLVNEPGRVTPKDNLVWVVGSTDLGTLTQSAARLPLPKLRKGEYCEVFGPGFDRVTSLSMPAVTRDATGALHTGMGQIIDYRHGGSVGVVPFPNKRQSAVLIW